MAHGAGLVEHVLQRPYAQHDSPSGHVIYDLAQATLNRLAFARGNGLRPYGIAAVALSPGRMRTELVLHAFKADEGGWRQVEAPRRIDGRTSARGRGPGPATGG